MKLVSCPIDIAIVNDWLLQPAKPFRFAFVFLPLSACVIVTLPPESHLLHGEPAIIESVDHPFIHMTYLPSSSAFRSRVFSTDG
jgi:hypothetical protein